ncbi:MAG: FadR family transcriptional regulator [Candidatus Rokubacteria bacterium]|nr:FadR family transcriptional regulator [Candidatus Rokubacteria bacterium]MBI3826858.1 FadR family transcriptional regulator [Candidatus Rokubacteria bacterium]
MFTSVRTPRVYEHIVTQIERAIFEGRLKSGDKLPPERQLVRQFRASRVALREALRTLEHRGLIRVRHGAAGGHFVRGVDADLLRRDLETLFRLARVTVGQLAEARLSIEPDVARLAALRATEIDVKALRALIDERAEAMARGGHPRVLDIAFHRQVALAARNPVHAVLTDALMDLEVRVVAPRIELEEADNAHVDSAHREIVDAIAARDPERARARMEAHIVDVQRRLQRLALGSAPVARRPGARLVRRRKEARA